MNESFGATDEGQLVPYEVNQSPAKMIVKIGSD